MYTFENSIFINRRPQDVFEYVTNPHNAPQWIAGVQYGYPMTTLVLVQSGRQPPKF